MFKPRKILTLYLPIFIVLLTVFEFFNLTTPDDRAFMKNKIKQALTPPVAETTPAKKTPKPKAVKKVPSKAAVLVRINPLEKWLEYEPDNYQLLWLLDITTETGHSVFLDEIQVALSETVNFEDITQAKFKIYFDANNNKVLDSEDKKIQTFDGQNQTDQKLLFSGINQDNTLNLSQKIVTESAEDKIKVFDYYRFFVVSNQLSSIKFDDFDVTLTNATSGEVLVENKDVAKPVENMYIVKFVDENTFKYFDRISEDKQVFLSRHPIFQPGIDNQIILPKGDYEITETIIIPKHNTLKIEAGTTLRFHPDISLLSYSPVEMIGTAEQPITVTAANSEQPWGIFGIIGDKIDPSKIEYALFEHGGEAYINGIFMSGMLAVHYADVEILHSKFQYAHGDDGLNVKNGYGIVRHSYFYQNEFDAVDFDFNEGEITDNYFLENGNDGADLGGVTSVIVARNYIDKCGDKGISMGEDPDEVLIQNNVIKDSIIGIAVKDLSEPEIINNVIINNQQGIAAYQKKEVFGGGKPTIINTILWNNDEEIYLDKKSKIKITYSDIQGDYKGKNNLDVAPVFVDPENGDYQLVEAQNEKLITGGEDNATIGIQELPAQTIPF